MPEMPERTSYGLLKAVDWAMIAPPIVLHDKQCPTKLKFGPNSKMSRAAQNSGYHQAGIVQHLPSFSQASLKFSNLQLEVDSSKTHATFIHFFLLYLLNFPSVFSLWL